MEQAEVARKGDCDPAASQVGWKFLPCSLTQHHKDPAQALKFFEGRVATSGYNQLSVGKALG